MKSIHGNRKPIIIAFIISLLFHISAILYVIVQKNISQNIDIQTLSAQKAQPIIEKNEPWAQTKTGRNMYGAPVLFKNSLPQPPTDIIQQQVHITPNETTSPDTQQNLEQHIDLPQPDAIIHAALQKEETTTAQPTILTKKQSRIPKQPSQQQQISSLEKQNSYAQPTQKKTVPTLAQLAQGFMHRINDATGNHLVSMHGPKKGLPSAQQMKYERYIQKLDACITNSFAIHSRECTISSPIEDDTLVLMVINRNGTLRHIALRQSSGNKKLDAFVLSVVYDASLSFPPIPDYLSDDPLTITFSVPTKTKEKSAISITCVNKKLHH